MWFQKISIPPPRRELEIPEGLGGQKLRKFQRGGGGTLVERSEVRKRFAIRVCKGLQRNSFHRQPVAGRKRIPRKAKVVTTKS